MSPERTPGGLRHAAALAADYRWALQMRTRSITSRPVPRDWDAGESAPVVLVPGVYETWHFLRALGDRLHAAGHPVHTVPGLGVNAAPIVDSARVLAARLEELDAHGAVLVAHSKGGLIGKRVLAAEPAGARVARLVAVATPFSGSVLARWTIPRPMRDFRTAHPVILELGRSREPNPRIVSIAPSFDPHIPNGSHLEGARNLVLPVVGHFGILRHPATLEAVARAVDEADGDAAAPPQRGTPPEG
ncbi:esterase/lipase family protein [Homoserinibacter sp. YIM 151385]|uniref:esterase/lipase family protein n=1 Tax=Homoserinibacter sp. YIM 151385 TaxID=2985506 RepID=UPI0022F057A5|nr:alpha/beta hydrolase [Homoserinibacter sp. YIM 151385]WBU38964.1 alpha/beta hydrolase [Homoserinibacter sp. YIM 151385]